MQNIISQLHELNELHLSIIHEIEHCDSNQTDVSDLNKEAIKIESKIRNMIEDLKIEIKKDDRIPTNKRENYLMNYIQQTGIEENKLSTRRLMALKTAKLSTGKEKIANYREAREKLLSDANPQEVLQFSNNKTKSSSVLAKEITSRLENARANIQQQISNASESLSLIKDSTSMLNNVVDASDSVDTIQSRTKRALIKLHVAQNWDAWILKGAIIFFVICSIIAIINGFRKSIVGKIAIFTAKKLVKSVQSYFSQQNTTKITQTTTNEL
ncbi:hypothetical protein TVAG_159550 [Trichomonas vaginalis G3]|uniref:Uncharacterized protein n=1 Tax=Trichomonas vaginalis (strain ATCC PRA-98 / G3) TaxID=412133 RepID=A2F5B0_TRIV3|nr:BNIP1-related family [Trichomonas vaginalis G3]EAX99935.1 hypothetical protein TVAG_159550 [Trichomonas vaginalis G3]KAI5547784.1 BNIP1-related family [Trichomonas vaginalis G3]|eukprot:XP_001312865.1 hypothetical protein [Trichomonas vaginalis G3]